MRAEGATAQAALGPQELAYLRQIVRERCAIELDETKDYLVENRLRALVREHRLESLRSVVERVRREPHGPFAHAVVDAMTTNETSWFRDLHPFRALAGDVMGELLASRPPDRPVTIWCAACSSGQEPYSVAMALDEHHPGLVARRRVRIVATDWSPTMVQRTRDGRYNQFEINRGLPARLLVRYFEQDGKDWVVRPEVRSMVDARRLNLVESWAGVPRCDVVLLRNVLIYFSLETKRAILRRLRTEALVPGGYLFLGASETTLNVDDAYVRRDVGTTICYQAPGAGPVR